MDYRHLDKTAMCYKCFHKEICKTVYQADDNGIQDKNWNCPHFVPIKSFIQDLDGAVYDLNSKDTQALPWWTKAFNPDIFKQPEDNGGGKDEL